MKIDVRLVQHLETLAALRLDPDERTHLGAQLSRILDYVRQLEALDVKNVPPTTHVLDLPQPLRPDAVQPSPPVDAMLANAPERSGDFYRVPRFVGDGERP